LAITDQLGDQFVDSVLFVFLSALEGDANAIELILALLNSAFSFADLAKNH
jgi:hypothetical protein